MKKKYFIYGITAFTLLGSCNKSHQSENKLIKNDSGVKIETAIVTKNESDGLYNYSGLVTPLVTTKLSFRWTTRPWATWACTKTSWDFTADNVATDFLK